MKRGAMLLLLAAATSSAVDAAPRRSLGFAGSTPPGQEAAFAIIGCDQINKSPERSRLVVPLSDDCKLSLPSPNGRFVVETTVQPSAVLWVRDLRTEKLSRIRGFVQPVAFRWSPKSDAFFLNDGEGSGQESRLLYFHFSNGRWIGSRSLDRAASKLYFNRYDCRGGSRSFVNVTGWNWTGLSALRVIVTEGVHSEGCLQPYDDRNVMLEVVANPLTGRIYRAREIRSLD